MADTKREIERKYEGSATGDDAGLPDLTGVSGVSSVIDKGVAELDATYYDTPDQRLTADSLTLRRRTGGGDAGWHLKLPVSEGVRDEVRAPLSDTVPAELTDLVRSRVRDAELVPLVRLRSARDIRHLVDASGALLAEVSLDRVRAERLSGGEGTTEWTEIEVELADDGDPAFLDKVEEKLRKAGLTRSTSPSKLAKALGETEQAEKTDKREKPATATTPEEPVTAGDHVLAYVRAQRDAIVEMDPAVRRDVYDSVHQMRVATRRMRSTLRSYSKVLDRAVTDPIGEELKWLAAELGVGRDQEVLAERLTAALTELPPALVAGPIGDRLNTWAHAGGSDSRGLMIAVLDGERYLRLLETLDSLLADPPLRKAAGGDPEKVLGKAVTRSFGKLSDLVGQALDLSPGADRDLAMHEARKKAKRTRYAAEAAAPALGKPAAGLVKSTKSLQTLLGDHQDSVMARETLRELAGQAHEAGEDTFTYGVLYGREEQRAAEAEAALPEAWEGVKGKAAV
ncbi:MULTISPECIES: CYTH and CHAD domain-containing protein [Streptomyces]|uniref:CHAD domain-containing protein n=1 Tax=Streptomyces dengpaensis TaxID=2049881 RepID=A0ABM6SWA3_9ACTN|nr:MULTISPECIES: CYTH and CHAD domain-containing protein [Streptomyces]AVH58761.1 CHAD domain-containing protein [Streptomyces dengpaensis]PIB11181.1 metal-binding protein [Streptomyces sp. HG99]